MWNLETQANARNMSVSGVHYSDVLKVWPKVSNHIQRALDVIDSGYSLEDLLTAIQLRDKQLWVINDFQAAAITSICILPRWKKLVVEYLGGDGMDQWCDEWFEAMQKFAEEKSCKYIEAPGRKGWVRLAKSRGDKVEVLSISRQSV